MAWMRMMGVESVDYHRKTIIERGDDHPGAALSYYASRGETPLVWGGSGAERMGLTGAVTDAQYCAVYGPGGAVDPTTGERLVATKRPGMELVISAHKSVAELGVMGRAEDMHAIMDAERDATLAYLDDLTRTQGGRRGRAAVPTPTAGLVYATARHATTRAGDPGPHDHVLLANVVEMGDARGGYKAPDTALWREHVHAATMVGRLAAAAKAVELGYGIVADAGPSGRLGHWAVAGIPEGAMAVHSKRSAEIEAALEAKGYATYQARQVAARTSRAYKRHDSVADLLPIWRDELATAGFPVEELVASVDTASAERELRPERTTAAERAALAAAVLGPDGALSERKVFARRDVIVAVAPALYGADPAELAGVVDRVLADPEAVPLIGVPRASERPYATATVLAAESAIAATVAAAAERTDAPAVSAAAARRAVAAAEERLGGRLTAGQRAAVMGIATSGRGAELVEGVAGSGKTTALAAVRDAFEGAGFTVVGTATSGQAARTLGREAGIDEARTVASLRWRLDHATLALDGRSVLVLDEAGMTDDADVVALLEAARMAGAKVVMVGDDRQLGAVDPGGAHGALVARHPEALHVLDENVRQRDEAERAALAELRAGDVDAAVDWYLAHDRVVVAPTRDEALDTLADRWAADALAGDDAAMFAWRRANVAELNQRGRQRWREAGRLSGPEVVAPGGARYAAGDRIVTLAPGADGAVVTSERGEVAAVDAGTGALSARMEDGRLQRFAREETGAERLAHGYALTVHRSQGATVEATHRFEDGGGRELAYVAASRARGDTFLYVVADDADMAADDLRREWRSERRWRWTIDTGTPAPDADRAERAPAPAAEAALRRARVAAEREAVAAAIPADPMPELLRASSELAGVHRHLDDLRWGRGVYEGTPVADAARELAQARARRVQAEGFSRDGGMSRSMRRSWRAEAKTWAAAEEVAEARWAQVGTPEEVRLRGEVSHLEDRCAGLRDRRDERTAWLEAHPEATRRLHRLDVELHGLDAELATERAELDGPALDLDQAVGAEVAVERPALDDGLDLGL